MKRFDRLFRWRASQCLETLDAEALADRLSVEGLPYEQTPAHLHGEVTAFRHLRHDARVSRCAAFVAAQQTRRA